jgi:hypothetical protein
VLEIGVEPEARDFERVNVNRIFSIIFDTLDINELEMASWE